MTSAALDARLDHVATAVPDIDAAVGYWVRTVGAGLVAFERNEQFNGVQVRLSGGGKLELLAPPPFPDADNFVVRFLERFGPTIHHVTLKVDDLGAAIDTVQGGGYDVVDVQTSDPYWREGFLRPSQVGGLIVQLAWASEDDAAWARRLGVAPTAPETSAPRLHGVTVAHRDLGSALSLWTLLGADATVGGDGVWCRWPDSPLDLKIVADEPPGPIALRFTGALPAPAGDLTLPPISLG